MARPEPSSRSAYKAFVPLTTRWSDNDAYGHMNNVVHYALFDTAVNQYLIEQGALDIRGGEQIGLVVETRCSYFAEMAFPDRVTAGLRADRVGNSSVTYGIGLFRGDADEAAAEGRFTHVYVGRETRRPEPLSRTLRETVEAIAA
ncbi:acyl-CoA thioesterase [Parvularcula sp. ZS-1/3]|uniref:Acyl-CoA thioesterase n=1 Tax=Parvularcula mediterranea TaxID=2732508 RepID=A0A7Y3RLC6_9PROT|nr:thioesterase family protein [Parvularcula mediterranea]NNU16203.1 acyl-CoA thioesterase [Parvularcula mediterranea]